MQPLSSEMNFMKLNRRLFLFLQAIVFPLLCLGANPNGYYNSVSGKKTQALKAALSTLLLNHTVQEYNSLWTFFPSTDKRPDGSVWDMYSSTVRYFGSTSGMNREHSFPKSWWGGDVNAAYTDINHLYPADGDANLAKSYYPLGEVGTSYFNNGTTNVGLNSFAGYSTSSYVFEPADEYKGDFARTYFYMVTCYQNLTWKYTFMVDQNLYPTLKPWAVNLLMKWHREDPVSAKETNRNEAIFKIQNNRNPFIDYPQLAEYLWGDSTAYAFNASGGTTSTTPVLATPTNDTRLDFGCVIVGDTKQRTLYVKGANLNAALSVYLWPANDYGQFAASNTSIAQAQANAGTNLVMTYSPTVVGTHSASVLVYDGGIQGSVQVYMTGTSIPLDSLKSPEVQVATSIASTGFTANWKSANYADSYCLAIYSGQNGQVGLVRTVDSIPENAYEVSGLDSTRNYFYTVKTRIGSSLSVESAEMPVSLLVGLTSTGADNDLRVYAASATIFLQSPREGELLRIFDASGRMVRQDQTTGHIQSFSGMTPGLYLVRCGDCIKRVLLF
jgi:endonuclease I